MEAMKAALGIARKHPVLALGAIFGSLLTWPLWLPVMFTISLFVGPGIALGLVRGGHHRPVALIT